MVERKWLLLSNWDTSTHGAPALSSVIATVFIYKTRCDVLLNGWREGLSLCINAYATPPAFLDASLLFVALKYNRGT